MLMSIIALGADYGALVVHTLTYITA
jgi:hypothetical protein